MKALRKVVNGQDLELRDVPEPSPGPGEVLLRIHPVYDLWRMIDDARDADAPNER